MRESVAGEFRTPLLALLGALGFALLLLCINIGYLRRVHLETRTKEIALRLALGGGHWVLVRQLFIETVVLFAIGGGLGVLVTPAGVRLLESFVPAQQIPWLHARVDAVVLAGSIALSLITAAFSGLLPVLGVFRSDLARSLGSGRTEMTKTGSISLPLRGSIILAEIALTVVPLCGAGLLIRSFVHLHDVIPGFDPKGRLTFSMSASKGRYAGPKEITALVHRIREEVLHIPGVQAAGLGQSLPFTNTARWLQAITRTEPKGIRNFSELPLVRYTVITPGYLEAMGVPLRAGRLVTEADSSDSVPVMVINETLSRKYFAGENPIGKQVWIGHAEALPGSSPRTIVGVIGDMRMYALDREPDPAAWVPMSQQQTSEDIWRNLFLVAKTETNLSSTLTAIRERVRAVDAQLAIADVAGMDARVRDSLWRQRLSASVMGALGLAALGIAVLGVFGVTSYRVARRSKEIGVRMALGARPADILAMVLREGLVLVTMGIGLGVLGALGLTRILQGLLFGVRPTDPTTFGLVALVLSVAAIMACLLPARRAARLNPSVALRLE